MTKIRRFDNFQHKFSFTSQAEDFNLFFNRFLEGDLGKIHSAIPWNALIDTFGLFDREKGPVSIFGPQGKLALMFLKHYACCSDKRLVEQLNGNVDYQFFCGIHLGSNRLTNYRIVSEIRCELAKKLNMDKVQQALFDSWSPLISDGHSIVMDATCYESEVRYPTNEKLLWESVEWSYRQLKAICKALGIKTPRTKYLKWKRRNISYSKMRRKTKSKRRSLDRSLLLLLDKINDSLCELEKGHDLQMPKKYYRRRATINKIYAQQFQIFHTGEKPKGRIVSIGKDYLRPIVRGKEIKPVEFGAKVNKYQIDGINFIEHLSFNAFHEGNRFKDTIFKAQRLTKTKTRLAGADAIYATNKNRSFATKYNIRTDFKRKGRAGKHEKQRKQMAAMITKERATRLEGSFGKEKEHYHLKKIKARTKETETLWVFFGIQTANALEIGRRMANALQQAA
ncbi:MAG: transposase [Maribacter sp.]|nr:transposase [Maribacter sp.]